MAFTRNAQLGLFAFVGMCLAGLVGLWTYRLPIAQDVLASYFARRGVEVSYEIKAIEVRRQRLEKVRIGPAAAPDLVADWIEIDVGPALSGFSIKAVRAGGVRLRARYGAQKISFGVMDRLLPPPSAGPFRLPDLDLSLEDARARLDTPYGPVGLRLDGQGNLRSGFEGQLAAVAPLLQLSTCTARQLKLFGDVSIVGARPTLSAPLRIGQLDCGTAVANGAELRLAASMAEDGADWKGRAALVSKNLAAVGWRATQIQGDMAFQGRGPEMSAQFTGRVRALGQANGPKAGDVSLTGRAVLGQRGILARGQVEADRIWAGTILHAGLQRLAQLDGAAVIGPAARQLGRAVAGLDAGARGRAAFSVSHVDGQTGFSLSNLALISRTGARLDWPSKEAIGWGPEGLTLNGRVRFGGGGFPAGRGEFGGRTGIVQVAPYVVRGARVALAPVRVRLTPSGIGVATRVTLDGPLPGGRVQQLTLPIIVRPGAYLPTGCFPTSFRAMRLGSMQLGRSAVQTCLLGQSLRVQAPRLAGHWSGDPFQVSARSLRAELAGGRLHVADWAMRVGGRQQGTAFSLTSLEARTTAAGWEGTTSGLAGTLGTVPLRLANGQGRWRFAKGVLGFDGQAQVDDPSPDPKFFAVRADQIRLSVRDGRMMGEARLRSFKSGTDLSRLAFHHDLASSRGGALLNVDGLVLGNGLQPEEVTPMTLGVVANVQGAIRGQGQINWSPEGVTSEGRFASDGLDFAAAFGPVTGMAGEIAFVDLLNLITAADQQMRVASINPGVIVGDGIVRYRILPGYKVEVLSARWPFAGGVLALEPTVLDMSQAAMRRLTFRVEGLDAARFIEAMGFENIAATGVYDGLLPMVFDDQGGRIEGGRLVARGAGTLSYVGPVSNENLGAMGRFAFDALKSMRYDRLSIDLDGAIDGDVITRISFAGVNQAPVAGGRTRLPIKILGVSNLPFIFNVTISAKFRQLFDMAKSFNDPSVLINRLVPRLEPLPKGGAAVQPADSPPKR